MKTIFTLSAIIFFGLSASAQSITGTVYSGSDSTAIPGVNVLVEGTYLGTFTDMNGNFNLKYDRTDSMELKLSAIGFQPKTVLAKEAGTVYLAPSNHLKDEVVLTATRANRNTATAYTDVDLKKLESRNFGQDIPYLLEMEPSVVVTSDAGAGVGYTGIRIRGTDPTRINVTLNGIPLNDSESHGVWWVNMPDMASSINNIQVQRGVGTSSNGAAAFGASLNMQTNTLNKDPYATITNGFGTFNTWKHTVAAGSGLLANHFSLDARLSKISSDGYIDRATSNLRSFYVSGAFHGKKSLLRVNIFSGIEETYQAWYGTPESRITGDTDAMNAFIARNYLSTPDADNLLNSGRTYNNYTYDNEVDHYQQDHYQLIFSHELSSKLNININGHYTRGRGYFEQFKTDDDLADYGLENVIIGADTISSSDIIRRRWLDNHFYGFSFGLNYNSNKRFRATLGGGWNQYLGDHFGEVIWAEYASNGDIRHRYYDNSASKNDLNIYAKFNYFVHAKVSLFADVQFRRIDYTFEGPYVKPNDDQVLQDQTLHWLFLNPKAGINYEIDSRNRIYGSVAIGNREPSRTELVASTQITRPTQETLYDYELGYAHNTRKYRLAVNAYWMHYKNQLVLSGKVNDVGAYIKQNVDNSDRYGIELSGSWNIFKKLNWAANFTYSQNRISNFVEYVDDYDNGGQLKIEHGNTDISFSPNYIAGSELNYEVVKDLHFAFITKYVGEQFLDNTSNRDRKLDAYLINNVRIDYSFSWKFFKEIGLGVQFNNIFNELYESNGYTFSYFLGGETTTENFYYPQAGFNIMTSLSVKF